jgi:NAD(P)-dependent dehydrogenase (short-subunit alcohol dehydrogenase family)
MEGLAATNVVPSVKSLMSIIVILLLMMAGLSLSLTSPLTPNPSPFTFVILGGAGKIGTAVAAHLSRRSPGCEIVLVGRRSEEVGKTAIQEVQALLASEAGTKIPSKLSYEYVADIWDPESIAILIDLFTNCQASCVIHTAGPYADRTPTVLDAAIAAGVAVYVDVSDPVPFLEMSLERNSAAVNSNTSALCAAGAFPGMSNVLAMEAASVAQTKFGGNIEDVRFNYFTKGLGGSGTINLYITNLGFGDPMIQHIDGQRRYLNDLSGKILGRVDFFNSDTNQVPESKRYDNEQVRKRVGTRKVFAWPFPEAATVASELSIKGSSSAAMGTAPDVWNDMLGLLVNIIPQAWWRSTKFSKFMADFSQPLVLLTDAIMGSMVKENDSGETHAMRVDVTSGHPASHKKTMVSVVQAHDSFRQCVGQSCSEFALDLLDHPRPGVSLPEQRYRDSDDRRRIIEKLTTTPGTFCYTGPIELSNNNDKDDLPAYPSKVKQVSPLLLCSINPFAIEN